MNDTLAYAMGWVLQSTPNGRIIWHNGGTTAYGAYIGTRPTRMSGVIVLTNRDNVGLPDAIGEWTFDRLLGNPEVDHVALKLAAAKASFANGAPARRRFRRRRRRSPRWRATIQRQAGDGEAGGVTATR